MASAQSKELQLTSDDHPPISCLLLGAILTLVACGQPQQSESAPVAARTTPFDEELQQLAHSSGLPIVEMSVPFDRLQAAPAKLRELARRLAAKEPGLFVMQYYDDTLLQRVHIFHSEATALRYIVISLTASQEVSRRELEVSAVSYEEDTQRLLLQTPPHALRLAAQDVTPVGA